MRLMMLVVLAWLAMPDGAQADVYVSVKADGSYVISNVHRAGRRYTQVYAEPADSGTPIGLSASTAERPYAEMVAAAATANQLPEALLHAVIQAESRYNPKARSQQGAAGLMQLMPDTARELGVKNVLDPAANIQGGARYLKRLMVMFDNDMALALAAYNAGPNAVLSRGRVIPPFSETQRYVPKVLRTYRALQGLAADAPL